VHRNCQRGCKLLPLKGHLRTLAQATIDALGASGESVLVPGFRVQSPLWRSCPSASSRSCRHSFVGWPIAPRLSCLLRYFLRPPPMPRVCRLHRSVRPSLPPYGSIRRRPACTASRRFASRPLIDASPAPSHTHETQTDACLAVTPGSYGTAFMAGASCSSGVMRRPARSPPLLCAATCSAPRPASPGSGRAAL
jgi:hypothetical protein